MHTTILQYCNLITSYAIFVYQFLLILKQFLQSYDKMFQGPVFKNTVSLLGWLFCV